MGCFVWAVYQDGVEAAVPAWLFVCSGSTDSVVFVFSADERRGIFWVKDGWTDVHAVLAVGESTVWDSHCFDGKSDNRQVSVSVSDGRKPWGFGSHPECIMLTKDLNAVQT